MYLWRTVVMKRILACKEKTRNIPIPPIPLYTLAHQEESLYTDKNPYNRAFGNGYTEMKMSIRQNMERIEILSFQNTWAFPQWNALLQLQLEWEEHPSRTTSITWICLLDAWKKFQTYSPKWWWNMVMNRMVESVKKYTKNKSKTRIRYTPVI